MVKNLPACRRLRFDLWVGKIPWRRERQPTPVFLSGELHGQRSLVNYSPWDRRVGHDQLQAKLHKKPHISTNFPHPQTFLHLLIQ